MPEFGQCLGGFDAKAVQVEIVLILIRGPEFLGGFGGLVTDGYQLHAEDIVLAGFD